MQKDDIIEGRDDERGGHYRREGRSRKKAIIEGRDDVVGIYKREG